VEIETQSDLTRGMTVADWWGVTERAIGAQRNDERLACPFDESRHAALAARALQRQHLRQKIELGSLWARTTSPGPSGTASTSADKTLALAPATTAIMFSPPALSTMISATPVELSTTVFTCERSTPPDLNSSSALSAWTSSPTAPIITTSAPARRAASAWLAPLPPGALANDGPCTVSPGFGRRSTRAVRSRLIDPGTTITAGLLA
jgi:hypothetical protein